MVNTPKIVFCFSFWIYFGSFSIVLCHEALGSIEIKEIITNNGKSEKFILKTKSSVDSKYSRNSANNSFSTDKSEAQTPLKSGHKNFTLLLLYLVIALFIILINVRVFYLVTAGIQRKSRSVNTFVAHLSALAIGFTLVSFLYVLEKSNIFSVKAPGLCKLFSFLRNCLLSVFPLNAVAIIYVRVTSSTNTTVNSILSIRVICLLWVIAFIGNFASIFMVEYSKDPLTQQETCKKIHLFGRIELTILNEVFRFIIFHFLVCFYMVFVMFQIRSKIRYLYILKSIPNPRMKRKVQRIRYLYLHSTIFILIWFPTGVVIAIYKVLCRQGPVVSYVESYFTSLVILCSSLFILSPLIYLLLHEDMSGKSFCGLSLCQKIEHVDENTSQGNNDIENPSHGTKASEQQKKRKNRKAKHMRNDFHEATDLSRISTLGDGSNMADQQNNPKQVDIPAVQQTSTSGLNVILPVEETEHPVCKFTESFGKETTV